MLFTDAICADNSAVIAFARNNAEKFKNEITKTKGVELGTKVTVQGNLDKIDLMGLGLKYDAESGEMVIGFSLVRLNRLIFLESCKKNGSFVGQNAFGVKTKVSRESCEHFVVRDGDVMGVRLGGNRIKMSPSQFRAISKNGVQTEFDLTVGHPKNDVVVDFSESTHDASIDNPHEYLMKVWTVSGQIEEIRWFLPGEKQSTPVWKRQ